MQDDKAHLWRWDLLECGVKSGVPELSQSDLCSGLGSGDTGHLQADHSCSAPGCHAHLGRLPGLGGNLGGVGAGSSATRAGRRCWRGGGGKVGVYLPPPPAPEATFGFIIGSHCCSIPLI